MNFDEIRKAANKAGCKDYQLIVNGLTDKGYYTADSDLENLGPGRPLDLMYAFPLYENESCDHKLKSKENGTTDEAAKETRRKLIIEVITTALVQITQKIFE